MSLFRLASAEIRNVIRRSYNTSNVEPTVKMFIDGKFIDSKTNDWIDLHDPATNEVVTRVPKCTQDEMQAAVDSSKRAFKSWSQNVDFNEATSHAALATDHSSEHV